MSPIDWKTEPIPLPPFFSTNQGCLGCGNDTETNDGQPSYFSQKSIKRVKSKTSKASKVKDVDDTFLANEMNELSVAEREKVYDEIHGVNEIREEHPELINAALESLKQELKKVPVRRRKALDRAFFLKPRMLEDDKPFQLMFLRADDFDVPKAARRMARYFEDKLVLFGEEKLVKKITLADMDEDDMDAIRTGSVQIVPEKDRSGRAVWFIVMKNNAYKSWRNQARYCWYQVMTTLEDEAAQIKGIVDVIYSVDMEKMEDNFQDYLTKGIPLVKDLPFKMASMHFCYSNLRLRPAMSLMQLVAGKHIRLRFRAHFGTNMEMLYELMTFGLPAHCMPISSDGSLNPARYESYLKERSEIEAERDRLEWERESQSRYIPSPRKNDVLLGRGRPFHDFPGNKRFAEIVNSHREEYSNVTDRFEKTCISINIVKAIQESKGRFLQRTPDGWEVAPDDTAREKVSKALRTRPERFVTNLSANSSHSNNSPSRASSPKRRRTKS